MSNAVNKNIVTNDHSREQSEAKDLTYAVDIVGLSKSFQRRSTKKGYSSLKSWLVSFIRPPRIDEDREQAAPVTKAIQDLTLRIPKGSSVGLIGRNGSGKSTFLKLLTGIYQPDAGHIKVGGKIAALIELGAGFHPDFTGRENVMLGGVMQGLTKKQILERFDDIVAFAELEHVIDDPVRTYSSGMFMRLGFSLAVHTDPDILLVDEVLAVGDAGFVKKCKDRIAQMRQAGKTLVLVTHDLDSVERWCDETIWLHEGVVRERGEPRRVIDAYRSFLEGKESLELAEENTEGAKAEITVSPEEIANTNDGGAKGAHARWGSREIEITRVSFLPKKSPESLVVHPRDAVTITIGYKVNEKVSDYVFGVGIQRADGLTMFGTNTDIEKIKVPLAAEEGTISFHVDQFGFLEGKYFLDVAVHRSDGYPFDYRKNIIAFSVQTSHRFAGVSLPEYRWEV
jgi:ABC-type polysaccharide/polyol phosphate transport system ATPase subunit